MAEDTEDKEELSMEDILSSIKDILMGQCVRLSRFFMYHDSIVGVAYADTIYSSSTSSDNGSNSSLNAISS